MDVAPLDLNWFPLDPVRCEKECLKKTRRERVVPAQRLFIVAVAQGVVACGPECGPR